MDDLKTKYVTVDEAANLANRKTSLIRTLCREGRLPGAEKMGNSWIIPRESVLNYQPAKRGVKSRSERVKAERAALREEVEAAVSAAKGEELKG